MLDALTPEEMLTNIGIEFNELRETKGKVYAWKNYQKRLMQFFGKLSALMSPKDITELCMKIEENVKTEGGGNETPLEECRKFLEGPEIKPKVGRPEKVH